MQCKCDAQIDAVLIAHVVSTEKKNVFLVFRGREKVWKTLCDVSILFTLHSNRLQNRVVGKSERNRFLLVRLQPDVAQCGARAVVVRYRFSNYYGAVWAVRVFETPEWMKTLIFFKSVIFRPCSVSNRARVFHEPPPSRSKFPRQPRPVRESPSQRKWRLSVVLSYVVERSILLWRLEKKCVPRSIQVFCCSTCTKKT